MTDENTDANDETDRPTKECGSSLKIMQDGSDLSQMSASIRESILKNIAIPDIISKTIATQKDIERQLAPSIPLMMCETIRPPLDLTNIVFKESDAIEKFRRSIDRMNYVIANSELSSQMSKISQNYIRMVETINKIKIPIFEIPNVFVDDCLYRGIAESVKNLCKWIPNLDSQVVDYSLTSLFESQWCPWALTCNPVLSMTEILAINSNKRLSDKGKINRMDRMIFSTVTEKTLNSIRKKWNSSSLDPTLKKLALESIREYRKKNYGSASIVLSALWEGIIKDLSHINKHVVSKELKSSLETHSKGMDAEFTYRYYDEMLMKNCEKKEDRDKDVPNRHGNQHGVFNGYPTKKSALNAIFFTDYLMSLSYEDDDKDRA